MHNNTYILRDRITLGEKSICDYCETENNKGLYCKSCGASLDEAKIVIVPKFIPSIICSEFIKFINSPRLKLINNFNPKEKGRKMKKLDHKDKTYFNYSTEDGKNAQDILIYVVNL